MLDPPASGGSDQIVFVPTSDYPVRPTFGFESDVLRMQVAPACGGVAVDADLMGCNDVLAVVQLGKRARANLLDLVAALG